MIRFANGWVLAVLVTVLAGVAGLSAQRTASACTPPPGGLPQKTVTDRVLAADVTSEGTVVRLEGEPAIGQQQATIRVNRYVTGTGSAVAHVSGYGNGALCLSQVTFGQHGIFYVARTDDGYRAFYLTQFDAFAPATPENIAEAIAAAGADPLVPESNTRVVAAGITKSSSVDVGATSVLAEAAGSASKGPLAGLSIAMAGLGALGVVVRRRR